MGDDAQDFVKSCWQGLVSRLRRHTEKALQCRACGQQTTWFSDMCENCGTKDPVMLPVKYLWAAAIFAIVFLLFAVWWL